MLTKSGEYIRYAGIFVVENLGRFRAAVWGGRGQVNKPTGVG